VACILGVVLILDGSDRIVSAIGGLPQAGSDGKPRPVVNYNYTFNHPHDVCVGQDGALYVSQWSSNRSYPIKLELFDPS
jgi:hypothetical protein